MTWDTALALVGGMGFVVVCLWLLPKLGMGS